MVIDPKLAVTKRGCNGAEGGAAARNVKMLVRVPSPTLLTELTLGYIGERVGGKGKNLRVSLNGLGILKDNAAVFFLGGEGDEINKILLISDQIGRAHV